MPELEEERVVLALSLLPCKRNNLVSISLLPPEILEEIFDICVSWLYGSQRPKHRLAWTQVCQSWRHISLSSSRLWQCIDLCDARFGDEFLVRSKQAPLSIVTPSSSLLKLTTDKLKTHTNRLRVIDVSLFPDDMIHLFQSIGPSLANLTSLSLKIPPMSPTVLLNISIPLIQRLNLDGVSVPWEICQNLTSLSLRGLNPDYTPSISDLYQILIKSPCLQSVRLESFIPCNLEISPSFKSQFIHLAQLKDLTISADAGVVTAILSRLSLTPYARLQLYLSLSDDLHTLFPCSGLPQAPNQPHLMPVQTIRLSQHSTHFLRAGSQTWTSDPNEIIFSLSSAAPVGMMRTCRTSGTSLARLCNIHSITSLELNTGVLHDAPLPLLITLFSSLNKLESLHIAFNSEMYDLFWVLQSIDPCTGASYVPYLVRMGFGRPGDVWWNFAERWIWDVVRMLRWRREVVGAPLESVDFLRCGGVADGLVAVREMHTEGLVARVMVHGV